MADASPSLYFQLAPKERADLEVVAEAAVQWARALRAAAAQIDPGADFRIEMLGAEEGSLRFLTAFERHLESLQSGWGKFPRTAQLALALVVFVPTVAVPTYDFYFGDHGLPAADRKRIDELIEIGRRAPGFEAPRQQLFKTLEKDRKIIGVGAAQGNQKKPILVIPRNQFAEYGGLFDLKGETVSEQRTRNLTMDVVLVSANFENAPRKWLFRQEGMPTFPAIMRDKHFLLALEKSTVREKFRSHIPMKIRLEIKEELVDGAWQVTRKGRSVVKVLLPDVG